MPATPTTRSRASQDHARRDLRAFLSALAGPLAAGGLFELRERHGQLMRRRFIAVEHPDQAVSAILRIGRERDVYLGAALRTPAAAGLPEPHGGRAAIACLSSLWVDADTPEAIARLEAFAPAPAMVIATGRGQHAYWLLDRPVDIDTGETANRRLAHHLAADAGCFDAARILRPPHTTNYCYEPVRPVRPLRLDAERREPLEAITADLPYEPDPQPEPTVRRGERDAGGDPLLALEPAYYITELLGLRVGRDRKVSCPFHSDQRPSLHVYPTAAQGWHCFSCRRGGSVYDLAAELSSVDPVGVEFLRLRAALHERLLGRAA